MSLIERCPLFRGSTVHLLVALNSGRQRLLKALCPDAFQEGTIGGAVLCISSLLFTVRECCGSHVVFMVH